MINIYDSESNEAVYFEGSTDFIVFLFLPRSAVDISLNRNVNFFRKRNISLVTFRSKKNLWWIDDDFSACLDKVMRHWGVSRYKRRIGYGISMGTFGAYLYYKKLKITELILFSPILCIDPKFEKRWSGDYSEIPLPKELILGEGRSFHIECRATLIYDPLDQDIEHVKLCRSANVKEIMYPHGGHAVAVALNEARILSRIGEALIFNSESIEEIQEMASIANKRSRGYIEAVLRRNMRRPRQTYAIIEVLMKQRPHDVVICAGASICLARMRRQHEALSIINDICGAKSEIYTNPDFISSIVVYLRQGGDVKNVLGHIGRISAARPDRKWSAIGLSRIYRFMGDYGKSIEAISNWIGKNDNDIELELSASRKSMRH